MDAVKGAFDLGKKTVSEISNDQTRAYQKCYIPIFEKILMVTREGIIICMLFSRFIVS